jgi:hypothetical protein
MESSEAFWIGEKRDTGQRANAQASISVQAMAKLVAASNKRSVANQGKGKIAFLS